MYKLTMYRDSHPRFCDTAKDVIKYIATYNLRLLDFNPCNKLTFQYK